MTILAGFTGSLFYVFLLTAVGNLEKSMFGFNFQTKLGEVNSFYYNHTNLESSQLVYKECKIIFKVKTSETLLSLEILILEPKNSFFTNKMVVILYFRWYSVF